MSETLDIVFVRVWWTWPDTTRQPFDWVYHWFNIVEGCAWLVFAGLVLKRAVAHSRSGLEIAYALEFCSFAFTDFREAVEQSSWLIWLKLINLADQLFAPFIPRPLRFFPVFGFTWLIIGLGGLVDSRFIACHRKGQRHLFPLWVRIVGIAIVVLGLVAGVCLQALVTGTT